MPKSTPEKKSPPKGKLNSIMDAVTALTSLGDEDSTASGENPAQEEKDDANKPKADDDDSESAKSESKRFIPEHKKPDAALTFPEKLMNMMRYADEHKDDENYCIGWLPDGNSFVIRNPDTFTRQVLPNFFKATKFQSFTRKLYRWGFRQVNRGIGPDDPIIFGNDFFKRDDEELMVKMRSVTAAGTRKTHTDDSVSGRKRSLEELDEQRKRILLDRLMQEKAAMGGDFSGYGMPLRPSFMNGGRPSLGGFPGMMMQNRFSGFPPQMGQPSPALTMYMQQQQQQQQQANGTNNNNATSGDKTQMAADGNPASEADIVNAAINALRYAS